MIVKSLFGRRRCLGFSVVALAFTLSTAALPAAAQINLSDIVAGGNGDGLGWTPEDDVDVGGGKFAAINLDNGTFMTRAEIDQFHDYTVEGDGFNPSPSAGAPFARPDDTEEVEGGRFIDSVFFLSSLDVALNQEGVSFPYLAGDEWPTSWNHVLSNRTHYIDQGYEDIFAGGTTDWETGIGLHASAGITFDLDAIREEHGADKVVSFSTFVGVDRCGGLLNSYIIFSDEDGIIDDPNVSGWSRQALIKPPESGMRSRGKSYRSSEDTRMGLAPPPSPRPKRSPPPPSRLWGHTPTKRSPQRYWAVTRS